MQLLENITILDNHLLRCLTCRIMMVSPSPRLLVIKLKHALRNHFRSQLPLIPLRNEWPVHNSCKINKETVKKPAPKSVTIGEIKPIAHRGIINWIFHTLQRQFKVRKQLLSSGGKWCEVDRIRFCFYPSLLLSNRARLYGESEINWTCKFFFAKILLDLVFLRTWLKRARMPVFFTFLFWLLNGIKFLSIHIVGLKNK